MGKQTKGRAKKKGKQNGSKAFNAPSKDSVLEKRLKRWKEWAK